MNLLIELLLASFIFCLLANALYRRFHNKKPKMKRWVLRTMNNNTENYPDVIIYASTEYEANNMARKYIEHEEKKLKKRIYFRELIKKRSTK